MNETEFNGQMERLHSVFTSKKWNPAMRQEYMRLFLRYPLGDLEQGGSRCIEDCAFFPSPGELKKNMPSGIIKEEKIESCGECVDGLVYITVIEKDMEYDRVAACSCERGKHRASVKYGGRSMRYADEVMHIPA